MYFTKKNEPTTYELTFVGRKRFALDEVVSRLDDSRDFSNSRVVAIMRKNYDDN